MLKRILNWFRASPKWEDMRDIPAATTGHVAHTGQPPAWKRNLHGLDAQARSERSRKSAATKWAKRQADMVEQGPPRILDDDETAALRKRVHKARKAGA